MEDELYYSGDGYLTKQQLVQAKKILFEQNLPAAEFLASKIDHAISALKEIEVLTLDLIERDNNQLGGWIVAHPNTLHAVETDGLKATMLLNTMRDFLLLSISDVRFYTKPD